jgi:hypothetical protein
LMPPSASAALSSALPCDNLSWRIPARFSRRRSTFPRIDSFIHARNFRACHQFSAHVRYSLVTKPDREPNLHIGLLRIRGTGIPNQYQSEDPHRPVRDQLSFRWRRRGSGPGAVGLSGNASFFTGSNKLLASKIQTWSHMASASRARRYCSESSRIVVDRSPFAALISSQAPGDLANKQ